jgi:hypothetical protein
MSLVPRCIRCDARIDAWGRDGVECDRCKAGLPPESGTIIAKWPAEWGENPMLTDVERGISPDNGNERVAA